MSTEPKTATTETHDISAIRHDISALRDDLAALSRGFGKDISDAVSHRGSQAAKAVKTQFDEQPLLVLLAAAVIGFVGGKLLQR